MNIALAYKSGNSDKVYNIQLEPQGSGWCVNFQFGRRGSTLTAGTKNQQPVSEAEARKIFDKLVAEKKAKGYTEGAGGTPYTGATDKQVSGVVPQLLNPVDEDQIERFLGDDQWCAQEKYDGRNRLLRVNLVMPTGRSATDGLKKVEGINKLGLVVGIPQPLADSGLRLGPCLLAGEEVGDTLYAFDLLELRGEDLRRHVYADRYTALKELLAGVKQTVIRLAPMAYTTEQKRTLLAKLTQAHAEGIVFKRVAAPYTPGRPNSGGDQLKVKFYKTCSAIVSVVNAKRSVGLVLLSEAGESVDVGNVTIPPNKPVPPVASIIECRYLYCHPHGALFQPVYLGTRDDVTRGECTLEQLVYKRDEND
ncbi:MAG: WGR domain-containing protein [Kiritimatiellaeota bacterium]|nr:WGR domain-containing protein [Kiritimatiellota bacterium]